MRVVPDERRFVRGYVYEIDGQQIPMDAVEVVHFKRWHPANDYYGLSALEAGRSAVITDRAMATWNQNTFGRDHAVPAGILNIHDYVNETDFQRIKHEWRSTYGGAQRKTAFVRGGQATWQNIGLSHNDLDFLKGRQANRDEILNLFGVPVALVSENATEANAKVAERAFIERTLWPKLVRMAQKLTQDLLPFWPGQHVATFADIRPTDTQARLAEIRAAYPLLSINELRARYFQLAPVAWGERPAAGDGVSEAVQDEAEPAVEASPSAEAAKAELAQWERFAIKRLKRPGARPFTPEVIDAETAFEIQARLVGAEDAAAVRAVFAEVGEVNPV